MIKITGYFILFIIIITLSIFLKNTLGVVTFDLETVSYELPTILLIWANILFILALYVIFLIFKSFRFMIKMPLTTYSSVRSTGKELYLKNMICDLALSNKIKSEDILRKLSGDKTVLSKIIQSIVYFNDKEYNKAHKILSHINSNQNTTLDQFKHICSYKSTNNEHKDIDLKYFLRQQSISEKISTIIIAQLKKENNIDDLATMYKKTGNMQAYMDIQIDISKKLMENNKARKAFKLLEETLNNYPLSIRAINVYNDYALKENKQKKVFKVIKKAWLLSPSHELANLFISVFKDDKKNILKYANDLTSNNIEDPESIILKLQLGYTLKIWHIATEALKIKPNRDLTQDESQTLKIIEADLLEHKDNNLLLANTKRLELIKSIYHNPLSLENKQ